MRKQIKKWTLRLFATAVFIIALLLVIILKPVLSYAEKTNYHGYVIFHDCELDKALKLRLDKVTQMLAASECYNSRLELDICLNDGAIYPKLMEGLRGQAFGWGFYDKVVLSGTADYVHNYVALNGYKWNLQQLVAHEATHCMQFDKLGLLASKPLANIPEWKWEGYAEYISRKDAGQTNLLMNIDRLNNSDKQDKDSWAIYFEDGTIAPRDYYRYWLLIQYCMDIRNMSYKEVLSDTRTEQSLMAEMMTWYKHMIGV